MPSSQIDMKNLVYMYRLNDNVRPTVNKKFIQQKKVMIKNAGFN